MQGWHELTLYQGNDETLDITVCEADTGDAYDLDDATVELLLKSHSYEPDSDATVLSTSAGELEITSTSDGTVRARIDRPHLDTPGTRWWRLDIVRPDTRRTAAYRELYLVAM